MADVKLGVSGATQQAEPTSTGDAPGTPKYVTLDEADRMVQEAVKRAVQSQVDKAESRIQKQIAEKMAVLKESTALLEASGYAIPAEAQERARQQVIQEALTQQQQEAPQESIDPAVQAEIDYTNRRVAELYAETGVTLEEEDPEAKGLDYSSPKAFLISVQNALREKKQRVEGNPTGSPAARLTNLSAGGGQSNPILNNNDPASLISAGLRRRGL